MKERTKFVLDWEARWKANEGRVNVSELCRIYGVSRDTGYVWLNRYRKAGHDLAAIADRSSRPLTSPTKVSERVENAVDPHLIRFAGRSGAGHVERRDLTHFDVYFGALLLGTFDERHLDRGLKIPRRKRRREKVSGLSLD